jgi:hypothetical protein
VNEIKSKSVVLQVAVHAIFALRILHLKPRVIAVSLRECLGNLFVAIQAFESRSLGSKFMATRALCGSR